MNKLTKTFRLIIAIALLAVMVLVLPIPAYAQVSVPDVQQLVSVEVYRSVLELYDELYLIRYNLDYATNPSQGVSDTYIFCLMNGAVYLGAGTAYSYGPDDGYNQGIASIYFSATSPPTWNGAYTMYFDGNPTLQWMGSTAMTAMAGAVADDGGAQTDETAAANSAAANDMTLLPAVAAVGDAYYFGGSGMFDILTVNIGTAGTPAYNPGVAGWYGVWEYWDGDSWDAHTGVTDSTVGFTAAVGNHNVTWNKPVDWNLTTVAGIAAYWTRYRVIAFNTEIVQPRGTQSWVNNVPPPSINTTAFTWIDEGSVSDAQDRLTTRLRYIATQLEGAWGGTWDLIEDSATGKVFTVSGEEYFTNSIVNLRTMCRNLFYQRMAAAEFEHDILVTDMLSIGADTTVPVYFTTNWVAQTFTASEAYSITGVNLLASRFGVAPNVITVSLRATAVGGDPTGGDLATNIPPGYDGNTVTTDSRGQWIEVAFINDYSLVAGTRYAIVVRALTGNVNNRINWFADTGNGYAGGQEWTSNGGAAWNSVAANDMLFEVLARGGITPSRGARVEGRLGGSTFDVSNIATRWGTSTLWISTIVWMVMMFVLCWAMALATNSWDCTVLVVAVCTAYGWRAGFLDTIFMALVFAIFAFGVIYAAFWKKAY